MPAKRIKATKPKLNRKAVANKHSLGVLEIGIKKNSNKNKDDNSPSTESASNKKPVQGWLLLLIAFAVSLLLLFHLSLGTNEKPVPQNQVVSKTPQGQPVSLSIPAINVNANIQYLGVTPNGEMEVPSNSYDVGWFRLGSRPGEVGSAVIAGHLDGENGTAGVFINLYKLKKGDRLFVKDRKGAITTFVVRESSIFDPGYADDVFSKNDGVHLNLITCDGVWDGAKKSYSKRLVVFADIMH